MKFRDLTEGQRLELKQNILAERRDSIGESPTWGDLANADELVSDEDLEDWYGGVEFTEEDFSSK